MIRLVLVGFLAARCGGAPFIYHDDDYPEGTVYGERADAFCVEENEISPELCQETWENAYFEY